MAKITVRLFATLREAAGDSRADLDADDVAEMLDVLRSRYGKNLGTMLDSARRDPDRLVILVNGRNLDHKVQWSTKLRDGDEVAIFPPVSGG
ncbi:MAG TPA: ubiquitin-like small modifier protein 1 [Thermoplasmata archaeon]|jgi:molybdopterin synthase sulfur carrier subunit